MTNGPMSPGYSNTSSYQSSAWPWLTSSVMWTTGSGLVQQEFDMPRVTSWVTIRNDSPTKTLRFQFANIATGSSSQQFGTLTPGESVTGDWRITKICLAPYPITAGELTASVHAGLTPIQTGSAIPFIPSYNIDWMVG